MKTKIALIKRAALLVLLSTLNSQLSTAFAQGTAFTYQGRFNSTGTPTTGNYDLIFTLFDSPGGGASVGGFVQLTAVPVSNGLFSVTINTNNEFGATAFNGAARWLEIGVRTNCNCLLNFTTLTPRQPLTPAPYAIFAENVGAGGLSAGTNGNAVTFNNTANSFNGSYGGNGGGLTNVNAATLGGLSSSNFWRTSGNAGTTPGANFIGTTDNQPLELKVNNQRVLRIEPNSIGAPNMIGGSAANFAAPGVSSATISGGGANAIQSGAYDSTISGGFGNTIQTDASGSTIGGGGANIIQTNADRSTISGGTQNTIRLAAQGSTIGGGQTNTIEDFSFFSTIGGGYNNIVQLHSDYSAIGGGRFNAIQPNASYSVIGGGDFNKVQTNADYSVIGGGQNNVIRTNSNGSVISGGRNNAIQAYAFGSTVGGGTNNTIMAHLATIGGGFGNTIGIIGNGATVAGGEGNSSTEFFATVGGGAGCISSGRAATVPGGADNVAAGEYSFAAGLGALANHDGAFVWADSSSDGFGSTAENQFLILATGGVGIGLNNPAAALHVASASSTPQFQITQNTSSDYTRLRMNVAANQFWEMDVSPGATPRLEFWNSTRRMYVDYNGNVSATSFNPTSDRNAKENFEPVNAREVLDKVAALPLTEWNFKEDSATKHIGPMAQDFYAAFGVGPDNKHIATVDADGVALAAIQGLNQKVKEQETRLKDKESEIQELRQAVAVLQKTVSQITHKTQE